MRMLNRSGSRAHGRLVPDIDEARESSLARQPMDGFQKSLQPVEGFLALQADQSAGAQRSRIMPTRGDFGRVLSHVLNVGQLEAGFADEPLVDSRRGEL